MRGGGYVGAVAGCGACITGGGGCSGASSRGGGGRTRSLSSGIRMCETRTTESDLCAVEMHRETESSAFVVTISARRVIEVLYARAGEEVEIADCLAAAVDRELVCGRDFGEPVIQLDAVFADALLDLPRAFADALDAVYFADDGLGDEDEVDEAVEVERWAGRALFEPEPVRARVFVGLEEGWSEDDLPE